MLDILFKLINFFCHCFAPRVGGLICSALIEEKAPAGTTRAPQTNTGQTASKSPTKIPRRQLYSLSSCHERGSHWCRSRHKQSEYRTQPSTDCPLRNYASSVTLSRGRGAAQGEIGKSVIAHRAQNAGPWAPTHPILSVSAPQQGSGGATELKRDVRARYLQISILMEPWHSRCRHK